MARKAKQRQGTLIERAFQDHGRRVPVVVEASEPVDLAKALIEWTGSQKAARACIKEAAARMKKPRGQSTKNMLLLIEADNIRQRDCCTDNAALESIASKMFSDRDKQMNLVRTLRRLLGKKPLHVAVRPWRTLFDRLEIRTQTPPAAD
jgi:hypothetical protein